MAELSVSVIIPTYNRATLIPRAVRSALAAIAPGDEVIVVDDGSTDSTKDVLAPFLPKIRYVAIPNSGAGAARNHGIREASNPLVAFIDSDDEWMPRKLELQRAVMQARPDAVLSFSDFAVRDQSGAEHRNYLINWHKDHRNWNDILGPGVPFSSITNLPPGCQDFRVHVGNLYLWEMAANYIFTSTLLVNRELAGEALQFPNDLVIHEDWELFGRIAKVGPAAYLACETAWQFGHEGPRLTDAGALRSLEARIKLLERVWGSDKAFLAEHAGLYHEVLTNLYRAKAKLLLSHCKPREAREQLRMAGGKPLHYHMLTYIPEPLMRLIFKTRRAFALG